MAISPHSSSFMFKSKFPGLIDKNSTRLHSLKFITKSELKDPSPNDSNLAPKGFKKLEIGSAIIVVEAPKFLKTADSVPSLRANSDLVKPGDVGRIVSRKPKDVWAVRLSIGTYLIDGKYFKPLEVDE